MVLLVVYQIFKEELKPNFIIFLQKIKEKETLVSSFYEGSITMLTKQEKDMRKRKL